MKKIFIFFILFVFVGLVGLLITIYSLQEELIFPIDSSRKDLVYQFDGNFYEYSLESTGATISIVEFPVTNPIGTVLYFHGNGGKIQGSEGIAKKFQELGYNFFVWDYRGYGKSIGVRRENMMYLDSLDVFDFVVNKSTSKPIILLGHSLGSAYASYVHSQRSANQLILVSPFYSMTDMCEITTGLHHKICTMLLRFHFETFNFVRNLKNTAIFHGDIDYTIPLAQGEKLFKQFSVDNSNTFTVLTGQDHNKILSDERLRKRISKIR